MRTLLLNELSKEEYLLLLKRPGIDTNTASDVVKPILDDIKSVGSKAVLKYAQKYDGLPNDDIVISKDVIANSESKISAKLKTAIDIAAQNIKAFHEKQIPQKYSLETMPGINCSREYKAIENVGLYVPGGTAVLPSTMLMLGIPAKIAGCRRVIACSPAKKGIVNDAVLYAAKVCDIDELYIVGGAQAIGMMAYGTEVCEKVDKIFGPGNQYVTTAKSLVSIDPEGCAIDMPAGPSEVLVIADKYANPVFIAADMLSQAEHGVDSQVILVTDASELAGKVSEELNEQLKQLERFEFANEALKSSFILIVNNLDEAIEFSNSYAPEHLIINTENASSYVLKINNASSVFLGAFTPESVGDYASGTNHSLPTYGYAKSYSGVNVLDFMKAITFQELTEEGLNNIADTVIELAETEKLQAHANAVKVRVKK